MIQKSIKLYPDREDLTLTTYILKDSPEMLAGKKRPAVLVCPGGGYMNCSDREAEPVALKFASMGYHALVLRYSTYSSGAAGIDPSSVKQPNPETAHPAPVRDIGKAFLIIHENAEDWLLDTEKIAVCGFSAGAHNCAMYSVYWDKPLIKDFFNAPPEKLKPAAAILAYGMYNYHLMAKPLKNEKDPFAAEMRRAANIAFFATADPSDEALDAASPVQHVSESTPPCFLWATTEDTLVPVQNTCEMSAALAGAEIPFEVHIFEKGPHGLSLSNQASASSKYECNQSVEAWTEAVEKWLSNRFSLPLLEKPFWLAHLEETQQ